MELYAFIKHIVTVLLNNTLLTHTTITMQLKNSYNTGPILWSQKRTGICFENRLDTELFHCNCKCPSMAGPTALICSTEWYRIRSFSTKNGFLFGFLPFYVGNYRTRLSRLPETHQILTLLLQYAIFHLQRVPLSPISFHRLYLLQSTYPGWSTPHSFPFYWFCMYGWYVHLPIDHS